MAGHGLSLLVLAALAGGAQAETLAEVYILARDHDPKFRAARYEFEAVEFSKPEARAALLPTFALNASRMNTSQNIISSENAVFAKGSANYPTNSYGLTLTQPLFRLAAWRRYFQTDAMVQQAAYSFAAAQQDLMLRTSAAYLNVLAARDSLDFTTRERDAIAKQLDLARLKYKSGQLTVVNLHDVTARHELKESEVLAAQAELEERMQAVREITGQSVKAYVGLPPARELPLPQPANIEAWVDQSRQQNLLVKAREQSVSVAEQEIKRQKAGWFPQLDLRYDMLRRDTGGSLFGGGSNVETRDLSIVLNWPLFEGGATMATTNAAERRYMQAREDLERDQRQVERDTRAAYRNLLTGQARIRALDLSVKSFESARNLKAEAFKAGLVTVLPVLDAERDLYAAKRDASQTRNDFLLNTLKLKQAIGVLGEEDLMTVSKLMQP